MGLIFSISNFFINKISRANKLSGKKYLLAIFRFGNKGKKKKFKIGRSDVRSSLTYPPKYLHQISLDAPWHTYLHKNLTSYENAPHFEICHLVKSFTSRKVASFAPSLLNDRAGKFKLAPTILVLKTRIGLWPWKKIRHPKAGSKKPRSFLFKKKKRQPGLFSFWITMTLFFCTLLLQKAGSPIF